MPKAFDSFFDTCTAIRLFDLVIARAKQDLRLRNFLLIHETKVAHRHCRDEDIADFLRLLLKLHQAWCGESGETEL